MSSRAGRGRKRWQEGQGRAWYVQTWCSPSDVGRSINGGSRAVERWLEPAPPPQGAEPKTYSLLVEQIPHVVGVLLLVVQHVFQQAPRRRVLVADQRDHLAIGLD